MKAVIMAGGEGTRLRPLTCLRPKPMVTVANKPVMQHIIELLKRHDIRDVAVTLQYMPQMIEDYFQDGSDFDINLNYFIEETPLGTAGSVKNAEEFLDSTFVVISGDALTDIDLTKAIEFHKKNRAAVTLVLKRVDIPLEYGVVVTDDEGNIKRFLEKPSWSEVFSDTANTGIYIIEPEILKYFEKGKFFDFSKDLFPMLLKEGKPMFGYITEDYWCDIGDLKAYIEANEDALNGRVKVQMPYEKSSEGLWIGDNVTIEEGAKIEAPCIIGEGSVIHRGAKIGNNSILGSHSNILDNSSIKRSIILSNSVIGPRAEIRGAIVCEKVHINEGTGVFENAVIGDNCILGRNVIVKPNVKLWPEKVIEDGVELHSNVIWGVKAQRSIFGTRGVTGEVNVDIPPEFASRLGSAFASTLKARSSVAVACDGSAAAKMMANAVTCGILSFGTRVCELGYELLPVTRFAVKKHALSGAVYISTKTEGSSCIVCIEFINEKGINIEKGLERKIENLFFRDDFKRCMGLDVAEVFNIENLEKQYLESISKALNYKKANVTFVVASYSKKVEELVEKIAFEKGINIILPRENLDQDDLYRQVSGTVKLYGADFGAVIHKDCEKVTLFDSTGTQLGEEQQSALAWEILLKNSNIKTLVAPISESSSLDELAKQYGSKIERTKTADSEIMKTIMLQKDDEADILLKFSFDGFFKLFHLLSGRDRKTTADLDSILKKHLSLHIRKKEIHCPWNLKGRVIRELIREKEAQSDCQEGVKILTQKGWVLVLPDAEKPMCRIISEAVTVEIADELCSFYEDKVKKISENRS